MKGLYSETGNTAVSKINTKLRPDRTLAQAWQREALAEQSTIAYTLNALDGEQLAQLRQGSQAIFRANSQTMKHDFERQWLLIDIDPTGLPASGRAQGCRQGYFAGKRNQDGRKLARLSVPADHETLSSLLYPANQQACTMLKPSIRVAQEYLGLSKARPQRTIIRSDAGLGTEANINWLLWADYQGLMKGFSGPRAASFANQLTDQDWLEAPKRGRWIALAPNPPRYGRRINVLALRWLAKKGMRYGTLLSTLSFLDPLQTWPLHDGRGAMAVEIKADKQGLKIPNRPKKSLAAQEGLILLSDLAHNLLAWTHHWLWRSTDG